MSRPNICLINIDSALNALPKADVTAEIIEARISSLAFKNFDSVEKRLRFMLEFCTHEPSFWIKLAEICAAAYFLKAEREWVLVFPATIDCGYMRSYRFQPRNLAASPQQYCRNILLLPNSEALYELVDTPAAHHVFDEWHKAKTKATELPTELVSGRLANTSVERAMIFSRGDGCVVCGAVASCYAATTFGDPAYALLIQLPVCQEHLREAREHPSIFSFFASLFHLSAETDYELSTYIPDDLIPAIHATMADELEGRVGSSDKRDRGWHLWIELETGWKWLLRVGSLSDYAYMLYEPGVKKERYRADSAPDHPDLKFFPIHQHSSPGRKRDEVSPSFLYGIPLFDVKRLRDVGRELGAYVDHDV
ncbi:MULTISPECIES: hypothetical protein [Achromobacter]|uniref:hypothetical protein n=1 Tax=Achromobacter TaxID=222 RepID=UPI0011C35497|nr:hypothetical protein [Achromobacter sp. K91]